MRARSALKGQIEATSIRRDLPARSSLTRKQEDVDVERNLMELINLFSYTRVWARAVFINKIYATTEIRMTIEF